MKSCKILEHTADARLKIEASTLPELFEVAMEGMMSIAKESRIKNQACPTGLFRRESKIKRSIEIRSPDKTALLVDFLNEVLYQMHVNEEIYNEVIFLEFSEIKLKAEIYGQKVDEFDEDIKAVTYHEAEVIKNDDGNFETVIVLDI